MKAVVVLSGAGISAESGLKIVSRADIFLCVGTSRQVYPASQGVPELVASLLSAGNPLRRHEPADHLRRTAHERLLLEARARIVEDPSLAKLVGIDRQHVRAHRRCSSGRVVSSQTTPAICDGGICRAMSADAEESQPRLRRIARETSPAARGAPAADRR